MKRIALLTAFLTLVISVSGASARTYHTVKKGDNLHDIARQYQVSVKDILQCNNVDPANLKLGKKIVIPVKGKSAKIAKKKSGKQAVATAASSRAAAQEKQEQAGAKVSQKLNRKETVSRQDAVQIKVKPDEARYHYVRKGDTLKAISKKYGISVSDIKIINQLRSAKIRTGQKLLVKRSTPNSYIVRKGDNLWQIAKRFDMDPDDLMEINEMSSSDLKIGQKLYLEEKPEAVNVDQKYFVMAKKIEDDLKKIPEEPEFAEKNTREKLIIFAKKLMNIPYKFGGNTILGIDCSAYVKKVYGLMGVNLPRTAREQFNEGEEIEKEELSAGDLVFFRTYASFPSHVGIYLGNNLFIHASSKGRKVKVDNLDAPYYIKRFIGAKRLISSEELDEASSDPAS